MPISILQYTKRDGHFLPSSKGLHVKPVCYCAGYTDDDGCRRAPYNLSKLLYDILRVIPKEKRLALADTINEDKTAWESNDEEMNYSEGIKASFFEGLWTHTAEAAQAGAELGHLVLGIPGGIIMGLIDGVLGCVEGVIKKAFEAFKE